MSSLRIIIIVIGIFCIITFFLLMRSHSRNRVPVWFVFLFSIFCTTIGIYPDLLKIPAETLLLYELPMGRIITLLIISNLFSWIFILYLHIKANDRYHQYDRFVCAFSVENFFERYNITEFHDSIIVLIPVYNEEETIAEVINNLPSLVSGKNIRVIVLDDGSDDDTLDIVLQKKECFIAKNLVNRGGGAALRIGYEIVRQISSCKAVVTIDADMQHDPKEIGKLLAPIFSNEADFIIGSRVLGGSDKYSILRRCGVAVFSKIINTIMGIKITDPASGYRAFRPDVVNSLYLIQDQYHTAEFLIEAAKRKHHIKEVPIHIYKRETGQSKKGNSFFYALKFFQSIINSWLK